MIAKRSTPDEYAHFATAARRACARRIGGQADDLTGDLIHGARDRAPRAIARLGPPRPVDRSVRARRQVLTLGPEAPIVARGRAAG